MSPLSTLRAGAADSLEVAPDGTRRRGPSGYLLLNVDGWLLLGFAMTLLWLDLHPWQVVLATTPVYILIGFLLSLLLAPVYDRLGVGPASFGRALAISVAGSYVAGALWTIAFLAYRHFGAGIRTDKSWPRPRRHANSETRLTAAQLLEPGSKVSGDHAGVLAGANPRSMR